MANSLYARGKQRMLEKLISFKDDDIQALLVSADYTPDLSTHEFLSDVQAHALGSGAKPLANKTTTLGVFDASDVTWLQVAGGATAKAVVLFKNTGVAGTSPLLGYIDTITGFPVGTNGSDITVQWDNGAFKIFSL